MNNELYHYGVLGMKWGVRRYQPYPQGKNGRYLGPSRKYAGAKTDPSTLSDKELKDAVKRSNLERQYRINNDTDNYKMTESVKKTIDATAKLNQDIINIDNRRERDKPKDINTQDLSDRTDAELRNEINRYFLEKQYNELFTPQKENKGKEYVREILELTKDGLVLTSSVLGIILTLKQLKQLSHGEDYLYHHGILGQKWGERNGPPYPLGYEQHSSQERRKNSGKHKLDRYGRDGPSIKKEANRKISKANASLNRQKQQAARSFAEKYYKRKISNISEHTEIGKKHVDTYLEAGTEFKRIQTTTNFENFAFYATYKKHDINQYAGLFGKNLKTRAEGAARRAEKQAKKTGDYTEANALRDTAKNMQIHQLTITTQKRLAIPSEDNAGRIVGDLIRKDRDFHKDLIGSLEDSKAIMRRPSQQILYREALNALNKNPHRLTSADQAHIYQALNLSLTNHNERQVRMQDKFYKEMKKNGYSALLDLNDKSYSSYHAKSPVIVFDTDKVKLQSVTTLKSEQIDKLYKTYNRERLIKDIPEQMVGTLAKYGNIKLSNARSYVNKRYTDYLSR